MQAEESISQHLLAEFFNPRSQRRSLRHSAREAGALLLSHSFCTSDYPLKRKITALLVDKLPFRDLEISSFRSASKVSEEHQGILGQFGNTLSHCTLPWCSQLFPRLVFCLPDAIPQWVFCILENSSTPPLYSAPETTR